MTGSCSRFSCTCCRIENHRTFILARIFHELLSRDHETGNPLAGLSGAQRARIRWVCHLATAGGWFRGVPQRYVAGADTRGRQEGRPYPWLQQVIREISGLVLHAYAHTNGHKNTRIREIEAPRSPARARRGMRSLEHFHQPGAHRLSADSPLLHSG